MQYPMEEWPRWDGRPALGASGEVGRLSAAPERTDRAPGMQGGAPRPSGPLCSKCYREPRYPRQRWGKRCFALYHANRRARRRREREGHRALDKATTYSIRRLHNTPPPLFEQLKRVVLEVPKYRNRPESIRISLQPCRASMYIDVRTYLKGKPTRKGITIHSDLVPAVMEGMRRALQTSWDGLPRPWEREPELAHGQRNVFWPDDAW